MFGVCGIGSRVFGVSGLGAYRLSEMRAYEVLNPNP